MINRATDLVESGRYRSPFGYIMVDEFQDISPARARLLKALLDNSPDAQLFAVGDDWQAIYRFGGSDIAVTRMPKSGACSTSPLPGHDARSTCWPKADRRHRSPGNWCTADTT